jgi:hypothetical protein
MTADDLKAFLGLQPLPEEGGFYAETYRAAFHLAPDVLPPGFIVERSLATAIFYLLTPDTFSAMHRLPGDEIYHFYLGDPVELLQLHPNGQGEVITLGQDLRCGMRLQHVVPGGVWQGSRLTEGGAWALLGTTMAPGFDFADYEGGDRASLAARFPDFADWITALTR